MQHILSVILNVLYGTLGTGDACCAARVACIVMSVLSAIMVIIPRYAAALAVVVLSSRRLLRRVSSRPAWRGVHCGDPLEHGFLKFAKS